MFSNLVRIGPRLWSVFSACDVELATSWYSDEAAEHVAITGRATHEQTLANIRETLARSIPLRVGIIGVRQSQRTREAWALLESVGVTSISYDDMRQIGRGAGDRDGGSRSCAEAALTACSPSRHRAMSGPTCSPGAEVRPPVQPVAQSVRALQAVSALLPDCWQA